MASKAQKRIQAAALLGQGRTRRSVAAELDIDPATISRWRRDEEFQRLERRSRDAAHAERPTVRATLEAALTATDTSGRPLWAVRVQAARALLLGDLPKEDANEPVVVTRRIFVQPDGSETEAAAA